MAERFRCQLIRENYGSAKGIVRLMVREFRERPCNVSLRASSLTKIFKEGSMRFCPAQNLVTVLISLLALAAHAQARGADSSKVADDANDKSAYMTPAPSSSNESGMNLAHRHICVLQPSQSRAAEKLAGVLVERARSAWDAADREAPANRETEVERALVRTLERTSECSVVTHRAVTLTRAATGRSREPVGVMQGHRIARLTLAVIVIVGPGVTVAQSLFDHDANVGVRDRPHPEYDALGVPVGSFTLLPKVSASAIYDDNIFALSTKTSDVLLVVAPDLQILSNWNRNALQFDLSSEFDEYTSHGSQNSTEYQATASYRLDVDHASQVTLAASAGRLTQPRTSVNTEADELEPVQYDLVQAHLTGFRIFDRLKITSHIDISDYSFNNVTATDGAFVREDFQDHYELAGTLRADYAISPATALFIEGTPNVHTYDLEPPTVPFRRDSNGFDLLSGLNFQVSHLVTGEVGVGYQMQHYVDRQFEGVDGLALRGQLTWYATQLITVTLHADRTFQDSGLPDTAAVKVSDISATADYELLRNLIVTGTFGYTHYEYPGLDRLDNRVAAGLGATYLFSRSLGLTLGYSYLRQDSSGVAHGFNFDDNRLAMTLTLQR
jgi:hypothetical protein